jgi:16S rRNA (cytosine967-C5)-methyltransferase
LAKERKVTPRQVALQILSSVERRDAYVHIVLGNYLERTSLEQRDKGLVTELVYGTLRRRLTLDWVIEQFSRYPLEKLAVPLRNNLRMAIYQILFLDNIPAAAACYEAVELAKSFGHKGTAALVNGILRSVLREPQRSDYIHAAQSMERAEGISLVHSHPLWLVEHWVEELGLEETDKLCGANNLSPTTFFRTNTLKTDRQSLLNHLRSEGLGAEPGRFAPEAIRVSHVASITALQAFQLGQVVVQDEASMLPTHALAPSPGELCYDLCAGLGGKTLHMGEFMQDKGRILAFDLHPGKLELLRKTAIRLGITNVNTIKADAAQLDSRYLGKANGVLLDAPCSGWGVLRGKPDIRWRIKPETVRALVDLQRRLLVSAYQCLAPGGRLVYSTCTINRAENEDNVAWLLEKYPGLQLLDIRERLPQGADLSLDLGEKTLQLMPHKHGTDGFFLAALRKGEI